MKKLKEAPEGKYFYVHNGMTLRNLDELAVSLELMDGKIFEYHVNNDKNDFIIKFEVKKLVLVLIFYSTIFRNNNLI